MKLFGKLLFALAMVVLTLSVWCAGPVDTAIETNDGTTRTIDRIDRNGRRHGLQQVFVDGKLMHESMVEHGLPIWIKTYNADGSLASEWSENENYDLIRESR